MSRIFSRPLLTSEDDADVTGKNWNPRRSRHLLMSVTGVPLLNKIWTRYTQRCAEIQSTVIEIRPTLFDCNATWHMVINEMKLRYGNKRLELDKYCNSKSLSSFQTRLTLHFSWYFFVWLVNCSLLYDHQRPCKICLHEYWTKSDAAEWALLINFTFRNSLETVRNNKHYHGRHQGENNIPFSTPVHDAARGNAVSFHNTMVTK